MKKEINYEWHLPRIINRFEAIAKSHLIKKMVIFDYQIAFGLDQNVPSFETNTYTYIHELTKDFDKKDWESILKLYIEKEKKLVYSSFDNAPRGFNNLDLIMLTYIKKENDYKVTKTILNPFIKNTLKAYIDRYGFKERKFGNKSEDNTSYRHYLHNIFNFIPETDYLLEYLLKDEKFTNIFFEELNEEKYPRLYEKYKHAKEMFIF